MHINLDTTKYYSGLGDLRLNVTSAQQAVDEIRRMTK